MQCRLLALRTYRDVCYLVAFGEKRTSAGDYRPSTIHECTPRDSTGWSTESGGQQMRANLFWFSDGQWARIEPFIPSNRRGVKPKNNRRILSGIMHVLKSGCRWVDCPPEYGPAKTVYNRFNRWSAQGIWQSIFEAAAEPAEPPERMALDSTHVKAHRCAGGGKGGRRNRRLASPRAGATARFRALSISCAARGS